MRRPATIPLLGFVLALCATAGLWAIDLTVASVEVTQGLQTAADDITLVAGNATMVRVKVSLNGHPDPEPGVDAVLRVYANGVEIPQSPVYSINGPITAVPAPASEVLNDTVNFVCVLPEAASLQFVVTVNPFAVRREDNYQNNRFELAPRPVVCRKMVELAYVPVNYTPGGGLPSSAMIEPGMGDAFLRGIYKVGDWNYHRSPLPPPTHVLDMNISNTMLLNTLLDIRQNWLPGNPYVGNGQALTTPGAVAFGNTDPVRFQRTFAHEIGHCWGQPHNSQYLGGVGVDIEQQLRDPLGIAPVMPSTKRDVMVPSLNTADAWVAPITALDAINDLRSACASLDGEQGGDSGPADDAAEPDSEVLRIAGAHDHALRRVQLSPAMIHGSVAPSGDDPRGNVLIECFAADGARLHAVRVETRSCRESCAAGGTHHRVTALYANLRRRINGVEAARIVVRETRDGVAGRPLAVLERSTHAPEITGFTIAAVGIPQDIGGTIAGRARIEWSARDADGDALVADLLYSPDGGGAWFPVAIGETSGFFEFNTSDLPASRGAQGRFAVRVSDGMNTARAESASASFGAGQPPDVHLISPNSGDSQPQGASVVLHGSAWDIDDQLLPESSVQWTSDLDGPLGVGRLLTRRNLSVGTHLITLRGTDSSGMSAERTLTLTIAPRIYNTANVDGEGLVGAGDLVALLSEWGGHGLADIDLDGTVGPRDLTILLERWGS